MPIEIGITRRNVALLTTASACEHVDVSATSSVRHRIRHFLTVTQDAATLRVVKLWTGHL